MRSPRSPRAAELAEQLSAGEALDPANITPAAIAARRRRPILRSASRALPRRLRACRRMRRRANFRTRADRLSPRLRQAAGGGAAASPPSTLTLAHGKVMAAINPLAASAALAADGPAKVGGASLSDHIGRYFDFDPLLPLKKIREVPRLSRHKGRHVQAARRYRHASSSPISTSSRRTRSRSSSVNERFIEAYLAGAQSRVLRELLWREYPTDQRGSYFRQFWDVST